MKNLWLGLGLSGLAALAAAQEPEEILARVQKGGALIDAKYRRGDDGCVEIWTSAYSGDATLAEFRPLLAPFGQTLAALQPMNLGAVGLLALVCHGDGDLLAMTDAEFHFGALGIDASDVGLRQYLAQPVPSFDGRRGRAELLDRLLAIDRLQHRSVRGAVGELTALTKNETLPAELRERATRALAALRGEAAMPPRARLAAEQLRLPAAYDACLVIDHGRLPDLRWVTGFGRRVGMLVTANAIVQAGGTISEPQLLGGQGMANGCSEGPFWFAHSLGNLRFDQSCVVVTVKADAQVPVAVTWQAVGAFAADGWRGLDPKSVVDELRLDGATASITAGELFVSTDGSQGKARPQQAAKLLEDHAVALRALVPGNSKLWPLLAFLQLPAASGAELRVAFGDPAVLELRIEARDEDAADAWLEKGREAQTQLRAELEGLELGVPDALVLLQALLTADLRTDGRMALATAKVTGFSTARIRAMLEALVQGLL